MSDIILISGLERVPSVVGPQLGQMVLKQILEKEYSVQTVNFDEMNASGEFCYSFDVSADLDRMADYTALQHPRIVGFYTICSSFHLTVLLAERIHRLCPECRLFFGGPHASVTAGECLNAFPWLDVVCRGESEHSILPLAHALLDGGSFNEVPGVSFRTDNGEIASTDSAPLLTNEELTGSTVFERNTPVTKDTVITVEGGRGCPFSCTFCSTGPFWGRMHRLKPLDDLICEMDRWNKDYEVTRFNIDHDHFTANKNHIIAFCDRLIAAGRPYTWNCSSRLDVLDGELIRKMAEAGCTRIFLGIETGSARMQRLIRKNLDLRAVRARIAELHEAGISVTTSFIFGLPDETLEDLRETLHMMEALYLSGNCSLQLHRYFPLPMTEAAASVYDRMYFDENTAELSIYNRESVSEEAKALIRENKLLFCQFYSFSSPVREQFPFLQGISHLMFLMGKLYEHTCSMLMSQYGFENLYNRYSKMARDIVTHYYEIMSSRESLIAFLKKCLDRIVASENRPALSAMYQFECDYRTYEFENRTEPEEHEYPYHVELAIRTGFWILKPTVMRFSRKDGIIKVERILNNKEI